VSEAEAQAPALEPSGSWPGLVRSFGALAIGEGIARVLSFVALIVLARRLGPNGFGLVTLGTTLVVWFSLVVDSGTEMLNLREISRHPSRFRAIAEPVMGLRLALSAGAVALFGVAAVLASSRPSDRYVLWLFALTLPMIALNLRWMVLGVRGAKSVAVGNASGELLFLLGVLLFVNELHDTLRVPLIEAGGECCYALVVLAAVARRFGFVRPRIDFAAWRETVRSSYPLMVNQFARATVYSFDILLVAVLLGRRDVGVYGAAYKPVLFLSGAVGLFYVSFLSTYSAVGSDRAHDLFRRTVATTFAAGAAVAVALAASSGLVVSAFFGSAYDGSAVPLAILVWTVPILAATGAYAVALIAADRQSVLMRNNVVGAVFNVAANFAAVPLAGIRGAAVVTIASELLNLALNYTSATRLGLAPSVRALAWPHRYSFTPRESGTPPQAKG
jgi:O-antigen/teichoic acid export membrane protein